MHLLKQSEEIRVYRRMENGVKQTAVYKYSMRITKTNEMGETITLKITVSKDKFIFRLVAGKAYRGYVAPLGFSVDQGYIFKDINEFENKESISIEEFIIPKAAIIQETSDSIELAEWIVKKENLSSFVASAEQKNAGYRVITEEYLRSRFLKVQ